ncbi:MAG: DMT family transporter [Eubacteriales bacterium]|nr:DMT family transporter [Eubacteriales bacterium]
MKKTDRPSSENALQSGVEKPYGQQRLGAALTVIAGVSWGFSGTCAQFLFQNYRILTPVRLCAIRMTFGGILLMILALLRYRENLRLLLTNKKDFLKLVLFALAGITFNQLSYLEAINYMNSGTATVLQYIGPVLIMAVSCLMAMRLPNKKEVLALFLTVAGVFLIATHGNIHALYITRAGMIWGLSAAVALVLYSMLPVGLIRKYGAVSVMAPGMLLGGIVMSVSTGLWSFHPAAGTRFYLFLAIIVVIGTVIPYTLYLVGIGLCGAVKASMIASVEPVSATVCMVVLLGEPVYGAELVGFACIITTIFLLAGKEE